jgi:hypothetical protein
MDLRQKDSFKTRKKVYFWVCVSALGLGRPVCGVLCRSSLSSSHDDNNQGVASREGHAKR